MPLTKIQEQITSRNTTDALTNVLIPTVDGGWRDIYRAGWQPAGFNQQWGGSQWGTEMVDGATGTTHKFDVATGQIEDNSVSITIGQNLGVTYYANGFRVSEAMSLASVWVKLAKTGNPSSNLQLTILLDDGSGTKPTGSTPIANGTATAQSGRLVTSKSDGEWYRFVFSIPPILASGTKYYVALKSAGAVDASNYWIWKASTAYKYPNGYGAYADATPTWTAQSSFAMCFLIESVSANQLLQSNGQFDGRLVGATSTQPGQLKALCQPMINFYDGRQFTFLQRGSWPVSSTMADFVYGLDHDRIQIATNASGFVVVNLWRQNRTQTTITGTSSVVASFNDVAIRARTFGDGADVLELWVNGALQASITAQTFIMDPQMRELGTAWIGGGFTTPPVWTQDMQMTSLPSAQGWTYSGTPTEANAFSIQGGRLFQNRNAFAAIDTGNYQRTTAFSNTTGWTVSVEVRTPNNTNTGTTSGQGCYFAVTDGAKSVAINIQEFFVSSNGTGVIDAISQSDFKTKDTVFTLSGRGSDYYLYGNGKLLIDGTGKLTTASGTNTISFGDGNAASGEIADAIWTYVKYFQGGPTLPVSTNGGATHGAAYWSGNKTEILPALWNGSPANAISLRRYMGLSRNYVENLPVVIKFRGITMNNTVSTIPGVGPQLEGFSIGQYYDFRSQTVTYCDTSGGVVYIFNSLDGVADNQGLNGLTTVSINNAVSLSNTTTYTSYLGLHKIETKGATSAGTMTWYNNNRQLNVISRS